MKSGLTIASAADGHITVLRLTGALDGHTFVDLDRHIGHLIADGHNRIVLDLAGLSYIASAGVGCFIGSAQTARKAGGSVQLVNPSANVREIFAILGLESVLTIHPDLAAGLAAARA
jgi:anti-sigma B factor antagonist